MTQNPLLALVLLAAACGSSGPPSTPSCLGSGMAMAGTACATSEDCCNQSTLPPAEQLQCAVLSRTCEVASGLPLGETCNNDSQCNSRTCDHFCTAPCTADTVCDDLTACAPTIHVSSGWECQPACTTNGDCAVYGGGGTISCKPVVTHDGVNTSVCTI